MGHVGMCHEKKLSRFGRWNPEKFNFENLWKILLSDSLTQSVSD